MDERSRLRRRDRRTPTSVIAVLLLLGVTACTNAAPEASTTVNPTTASSTPSPASTSPAPAHHGATTLLIASGDIACAPGALPTAITCHQASTAALIAEGNPTAVLLLGDTQYEAGREQEYASFDATWGAALRAVPDAVVLPVAGNHEWYDPDPPGAACTFRHDGRDACGFEAYFGERAFDGTMADGAGSYARIFAERADHPLVVIMIDAGVCEHDPSVCGVGGAATRFLKAALADPRVNPPQACTLVAWHQARWSDVGHGSIGYVDPLWKTLFDVPGAQRPDLVLNGHDHVYERMPPLGTGGQSRADGIPEIIAGAGGREVAGIPYAGAVPIRAAYLDLQHFGVLRLEHDGASGDMVTSFQPERGVEADRQSLTCRT